MIRLFKRFRSRCPYCGSRARHRTECPRNWKLLPIRRCYVCRNCNSQYIPIFGPISVLVERGRLLFSACVENISRMAPGHCLGTPFALALSVRVFQWLEKWSANFPTIGKSNLLVEPLLNSKHIKLKDDPHQTQTQRA